MTCSGEVLLLVFTDLDGSLLDHHTYSYLDAQPQLHMLEHLAIPVILATSKTRAEIEYLRGELGNSYPFIVENGAAVFIPVGYFPTRPAAAVERDGYWICEMSAPRSKWLGLLQTLAGEYPGEFDYFHRAGVAGIQRMTNLPAERAAEANLREYSEPVRWLGDEVRKKEFVSRLRQAGASVQQGGRFLAVSGDCDKGRALVWLRGIYRESCPERACHDLAVGDSANDCAMLELAETALLVRSPVHEFPPLQRTAGVLRSTAYGPAGWAEGVMRWLQTYRQPKA